MFDYYVHFIIQLCVLNNKNDVIHCDITVDMALFVNTYSSLLTLSFLCPTTAIYCNGSPYNIKQCTFTIETVLLMPRFPLQFYTVLTPLTLSSYYS